MYLFKKLIYAAHKTQKSIYVYENNLYRWLCFDNDYVQTIINRYQIYKPILKYLPALCLNLNLPANLNITSKVVMLGGGGGAIAHYINHYHKNSSLLMVEHESLIIDLAKRYFNIKQNIIKADAFEFIKKQDHISNLFIDIFINQAIPATIKQLTFLKQCKLTTSNCVSLNLVSINKHEVLKTLKLIREVFSKQTLCLYIKNKSNLIVHAYTASNYLDIIEQLNIAKIIRRPQWQVDYGLVSTLTNGYY